MSSLDGMSKQLETLRSQVEPATDPPEIICCWGDEVLEEVPGVLIIRTEWGGFALEDDYASTPSQQGSNK